MSLFCIPRQTRGASVPVIEKLERRSLLAATFALSSVPGGGIGYAVQTADINGDGKLDMVVANFNGTVSIFLGNGNGTFKAEPPLADGLANGATSLAIADVNSDGKPDLVVASAGNYGHIAVLLNKGGGAFRLPRMLAVAPNQTTSVVVADFTGDGHPDIAAANAYGSLSVLLGNGDGSFHNYIRSSLPNATGENTLAVGDFNNDGKPDLVDVNATFSKATLLLGNGNGAFATGTGAAVGYSAISVVVADFNDDGNADFAVGAGDGSITVVLGNGNGTLRAPQSYSVASLVDGVTAGDVDGDGIPDIPFTAHGYYGHGYVAVLLNNGNGTFSVGTAYTTPTDYPHGLAVGDFTGDGLNDIAAVDATYDSVDFLTNTTTDLPSVTLSGRQIVVVGTPHADTLNISASGGSIAVKLDGISKSFPMSSVDSISAQMFAGDDSVAIGPGTPSAYVNGMGGNDTIVAQNSAPDTFLGAKGADSIQCGQVNCSVSGGPGNDTLIGGAGNDYINGNAGNDSILGGAGSDTLIGGLGNDTLKGGSGPDSLIGSAGLSSLLGNNGHDTLDATGPGVTLNGGPGVDSILMTAGDSLLPSPGQDVIGPSS